jgi:hypothetical protein
MTPRPGGAAYGHPGGVLRTARGHGGKAGWRGRPCDTWAAYGVPVGAVRCPAPVARARIRAPAAPHVPPPVHQVRPRKSEPAFAHGR